MEMVGLWINREVLEMKTARLQCSLQYCRKQGLQFQANVDVGWSASSNSGLHDRSWPETKIRGFD